MAEPTYNEVAVLTKKLRRQAHGHAYSVMVYDQPCMKVLEGKWVLSSMTFVSFRRDGQSKHFIQAQSIKRVIAHWYGFLSVYGALAPKVGISINISTGPGRDYYAKVLKTTPNRVQVQWRFNNGKRSAPRWFNLSEVTW